MIHRAIFVGVILVCVFAVGLCSTLFGADPIRTAVAKSIPLLLQSARTYTEKRDCFSCHHQALVVMAAALADERGFSVERALMREQARFTHDYYTNRLDRVVQGEGVPGGAFSAGYALVTLSLVDWPADETTDALVQFLHRTQEDNASWRIRGHRPPLEDSDFTATALSLRGLELFARGDHAAERKGRTARARSWITTTERKTTEDKAFHLFGLRWANADAETLNRTVHELLSEQRDDGGWAQQSGMASDAYATGQVLVALYRSGDVAVTNPAYRLGVEFLLRDQLEDGSWKVATRARPFQKYFESGFPHGKSQFISIAASCWATMAITLTQPHALERRF